MKHVVGLLFTARAVVRGVAQIATDTVLGDPCRFQCGARVRGSQRLLTLERHYFFDHAGD